MVSGGSRNDSSFRAFGNFGRPLLTSFVPSYTSAPAIQASVISGGSEDLAEVRPEPFRFALMTMSHADDASGRSPRSPDKDDESGLEPTHRNEARLTVIFAIVNASEVEPRKHFVGATHIETPIP